MHRVGVVVELNAAGRKGARPHIPPAIGHWTEMDSDDQTARWAFVGLAAHTLIPVLGKDADGAMYWSQ